MWVRFPHPAPFNGNDMTVDELRSHFNRVFGIEKQWPKTYEVDIDTYENCLTAVENWGEKNGIIFLPNPTRKLMFKGVELILKS